ncbi:MAG: S-layer protein [Candidatus Anstonellales archaeon]
MKGINLKKLGAIVAGSALLAGSIAFAAPVSFQNVELVNAQGQPVAKVVVGSKAALSDAVAAAKIAQRLANSAFVEKEYSAQVQGQDQLSCTVSGGQASCSITNKQVTLEVTVPGVKSTAEHAFGLLIAEDADRRLNDRDVNAYETEDKFSVKTDFTDADAHPTQDQVGGVIGVTGYNSDPYVAYKIDKSALDSFKAFNVKGNKFSINLNEEQNVFLNARTEFVESDHDVRAKVSKVLYQVLFVPDKSGLPLCPGSVNTNFTSCSTGDRIEAARVPIQFLGSTWYVTGISGTTTGLTLTNDEKVGLANAGTKLKLAKESKYGIVNVGSSLETDDGYKVTLGDIAQDSHDAIISVYDPSGNLISKDQIAQGASKDIPVGGGKNIRVHVYQTAPGYTLTEKWAELAILKDEIELEQGKEFIVDSGSKYKVALGLTNKNAAAGSATHLKEILLYYTGSSKTLQKGDSFDLADITSYKSYNLKYNGLNRESPVNVEFALENRGSSDVVQLKNSSWTVTFAANSKVVRITSGSATFSANVTSGLSTAYQPISGGNEIWYIVAGSATADDGPGGATAITLGNGTYLFQKSSDWYYADTSSDNSNTKTRIDFSYAGTDSGALYLDANTTNTTIGDQGGFKTEPEIYYVEEIGKAEDSDNVFAVVGFYYNSTQNALVSVTGNKDDSVTFYLNNATKATETAIPAFVNLTAAVNGANGSNVLSGFGYTNGSNYEDGFITPRGTVVTGTKSSRNLEIPKSVATAQFVFAPSTAASAQPNTQEVTLREGDTTTIGDVTVKAKKIDATATPTVSGAGAGSGTVTGLDRLSAVIVSKDGLEKVSSLKAATRVPVSDALVITDEQASGVATKIIVGGPAVNSAAADALSAAGLEITPQNNVVVKATDSKTIVVAGYTADDTVKAVNDFLAQLSG